MSYPEPRYVGDGGECSAVYRAAGQLPELPMKTANASYLATGGGTHGQFGLYRWDFKGPPSGPDPHFHRAISESFFILSGTVRLFNGQRWIDATRATSSTSPRAACTPSATSPASPHPCCCYSLPARPGKATSRDWPAWASSPPRSGRPSCSTTTRSGFDYFLP